MQCDDVVLESSFVSALYPDVRHLVILACVFSSVIRVEIITCYSDDRLWRMMRPGHSPATTRTTSYGPATECVVCFALGSCLSVCW